ncbi:MAG: DNA-binding protein [Deltaproteobacteria bacterium]|nr:MAG: DNA-binding protein [Deltaproteobacteria bacterium]
MVRSLDTPVDPAAIRQQLDANKAKMKLSLSVCAHCSLCAESCFLFMANDKAPKYMPSYKFINSIGLLYKRKGRVNRTELETIRDIVWKDCVLCTRCYCPLGIDIPDMLTLARDICRSQNVFLEYDA